MKVDYLKNKKGIPIEGPLVFTPDIYLPILGIIILVLVGFIFKKKFYTK